MITNYLSKASAPDELQLLNWLSPSRKSIRPSLQCDYSKLPRFSFFNKPITNKRPSQDINLVEAYNYLTSDFAKPTTEHLRLIQDTKERRLYKSQHFDYCTFSGIFSYHSDKSLILHSGLICLDFDHLPAVEATFIELINDRYFETLLLFRSPSGDGLKWVISFADSFRRYGSDAESPSEYQARFFPSLFNYIYNHYNVQIDRNCRNVSRACYMPYDPNAYISPSLL